MIRKRLHALISMLRWTTLWRLRWPASCHPQPISRRLLPWRWRCVCKDVNYTLCKLFSTHYTVKGLFLTKHFILHKIHETIESINQLKTQRDFMLSFSNNPQDFIQDWLKSQSRDLKVSSELAPWFGFGHSDIFFPSFIYDVLSWFMQLMTDTVGNPEEERRTEFYHSNWVTEAVGRYIFSKVSA